MEEEPHTVIPAQAGIQQLGGFLQCLLDSRLRGNDGVGDGNFSGYFGGNQDAFASQRGRVREDGGETRPWSRRLGWADPVKAPVSSVTPASDGGSPQGTGYSVQFSLKIGAICGFREEDPQIAQIFTDGGRARPPLMSLPDVVFHCQSI